MKRVVVKLGTGILTESDGSLNESRIESLCAQIERLRGESTQFLIVSSGAVGLGMGRLGLKERPKKLPALQKCAAVGQSILTETWEKGFRKFNIHVAQVLLTGLDILQPSHNKVFGDFIEEVLKDGIIPIINENDCVSTAGFKLGDNDSMSALLACRVKADQLLILSTIDGLMDLDSGTLIKSVDTITPEIEALAKGTRSNTSVGGMLTKIRAARLAVSSGCSVFIGNGADPDIIAGALSNEATGTYFHAREVSSKSRQRLSKTRWKVYFGESSGTITVDDGAKSALENNGGSLLPKGITACTGNFAQGDIIDIASSKGQSFARGIAEFAASDLTKIIGRHSDQIKGKAEAVHRDNMILLS